MTKTYEQRLHDLAEEMAKATWDAHDIHKDTSDMKWDNEFLNKLDKEQLTSDCLPAAAIALKHMAEAYENGYNLAYNYGEHCSQDHCNYNIQSLGLVPQNESNKADIR